MHSLDSVSGHETVRQWSADLGTVQDSSRGFDHHVDINLKRDPHVRRSRQDSGRADIRWAAWCSDVPDPKVSPAWARIVER